jgi:hypothetical protein
MIYKNNKNVNYEIDKSFAPIAGFCAGIWIIYDIKWRRNIYTILLLSKAFDAIINKIYNSK